MRQFGTVIGAVHIVAAIVLNIAPFLPASQADACSRCGLFGLRCRFAVSHSHHVAQVQVPPQTIVINNNGYPAAAPLVQQGATVYGYSQPSYDAAAQAYPYLDPALYSEQSTRLISGAQDLAKLSFSQASSVIDRQLQGQLTVAALQAAKPDVGALQAAAQLQNGQAPLPNSLTLKLQSDGSYSVETRVQQSIASTVPSGGGGTTNPAPPQAPANANAAANYPAITRNCASCHSGVTPKGGLTIDGTAYLSFEQFKAAVSAVRSGDMPKGHPLPELADQNSVICELATIIETGQAGKE